MRVIAMGGEALAEGFALLGFETYANASPQDVERVLADLIERQDKALVYLEHDLVRDGSPSLERVRNEGGSIIVAELPPLAAPEDYHMPVEELVLKVLGPGALEERE